MLEIEEVEDLQLARWPEVTLYTSTDQAKRKKEKKKSPAKSTQEVNEAQRKEVIPACAAQNLTSPHKSSYFLPGKATGLTMLYLVYFRMQHQPDQQKDI